MASSRSSNASTVALLLAVALCLLTAKVAAADGPLLKHLPKFPRLPGLHRPKPGGDSDDDDDDGPPKPKLPSLPKIPFGNKPEMPKMPQFPGLPKTPLPHLPNLTLPILLPLPAPKLPGSDLPGCTQAFTDIRDCVTFVLTPKPLFFPPQKSVIPTACTNAFATLIGASLLARGNRVATCNCVTAIAKTLSSHLPGSPIPSMGFPLPHGIDCDKIL